LGGKVEDEVRLALFDHVLNGHVVSKVAIQQGYTVLSIHPRQEVGDIIERATPPVHSVDVPIGVLEKKIGKVGTDHSGYAGD